MQLTVKPSKSYSLLDYLALALWSFGVKPKRFNRRADIYEELVLDGTFHAVVRKKSDEANSEG